MKKILFLTIATFLSFAFGPAAFNAAAENAVKYTPLAEGDDDDDEDEPPYVEPAFTVTINIDNADAVYFTVNDQPIPHTAGDNVVTVDPGDGYIKVHVNDGYAFRAFDNMNLPRDSRSYLQYDNQTMPVTIRKMLNTGISDDNMEGQVVDGHVFNVRTLDLSTLATYTLTVEVDDASKVLATVGTGINIESGSNRRIDLVDGINTVTYNQNDKYIHFSGPSFHEPLTGVTLNGAEVPNDGQMNAVYTVALNGESTQGISIVVTAYKAPDVDPFTFKAIIDEPENVKYFTKMPANRDIVFDSETDVPFKAGDYFEVWVYQEALECTFNGEPVEFDETYRRYTFQPNPNGTFVLRFAEPVPVGPSFIIETDDPDKITRVLDSDNFEDYDLEKGINTIPLYDEEENEFRIYVSEQPALCMLNGQEVTAYTPKQKYYTINPVNGDKLLMIYDPVNYVGVEGVEADPNAPAALYDLRGNLIKADATPADLRSLPAGIYILGPRKHLVK